MKSALLLIKHSTATVVDPRSAAEHSSAADAGGRAELCAWLRTRRIKSIGVCIDLPQEECHSQAIPRMGQRDFNAYSAQLLQQRFPDTEFAVSVRYKYGRQSMLLQAGVGCDVVVSWLDALVVAGIIVSSIGLLPFYLTQMLLNRSYKKGVVVAIGSSGDTAVRLTLIADGQLLLSRQTLSSADVMADIIETLSYAVREDMLVLPEGGVVLALIGTEFETREVILTEDWRLISEDSEQLQPLLSTFVSKQPDAHSLLSAVQLPRAAKIDCAYSRQTRDSRSRVHLWFATAIFLFGSASAAVALRTVNQSATSLLVDLGARKQSIVKVCEQAEFPCQQTGGAIAAEAYVVAIDYLESKLLDRSSAVQDSLLWVADKLSRHPAIVLHSISSVVAQHKTGVESEALLSSISGEVAIESTDLSASVQLYQRFVADLRKDDRVTVEQLEIPFGQGNTRLVSEGSLDTLLAMSGFRIQLRLSERSPDE